MRSYPVKDNPIDSAVSQILRYKQTNRQTDIILLCFIDRFIAIDGLSNNEINKLKKELLTEKQFSLYSVKNESGLKSQSDCYTILNNSHSHYSNIDK